MCSKTEAAAPTEVKQLVMCERTTSKHRATATMTAYYDSSGSCVIMWVQHWNVATYRYCKYVCRSPFCTIGLAAMVSEHAVNGACTSLEHGFND